MTENSPGGGGGHVIISLTQNEQTSSQNNVRLAETGKLSASKRVSEISRSTTAAGNSGLLIREFQTEAVGACVQPFRVVPKRAKATRQASYLVAKRDLGLVHWHSCSLWENLLFGVKVSLPEGWGEPPLRALFLSLVSVRRSSQQLAPVPSSDCEDILWIPDDEGMIVQPVL